MVTLNILIFGRKLLGLETAGAFSASSIKQVFILFYFFITFINLQLIIYLQKKMNHPFVSPRDCKWTGIIMRAIYMFTRSGTSCPFIPLTVDITLLDQFQLWLSKDPGDYVGSPYHNGLKLFLWIINDLHRLDMDQT